MRLTRRALCASIAAVSTALLPAAPAPEMLVFKTSTCGCCGKWAEHMKAAGFNVQVTNVPNTGVYRQKYGVPERLASCHTAFVAGYAVEGHVPAEDVQKLLKMKPKVKGISVPGMPIGSPGMEAGTQRQAYAVVSFTEDGKFTEFTKYSARS